MDPLSLTAKCVGLTLSAVKAGVALTNLIDATRDAQSILIKISKQVENLNESLDLLRPHIPSLPDKFQANLSSIVDNCSSVVERLGSLLDNHSRKVKHIRWLLKDESTAAKINRELEVHLRSLGLALETASLNSTLEIKSDTERIIQNLGELKSVKNDTSSILEVLRAQETVAPIQNLQSGAVVERPTSEESGDRFKDELPSPSYPQPIPNNFYEKKVKQRRLLAIRASRAEISTSGEFVAAINTSTRILEIYNFFLHNHSAPRRQKLDISPIFQSSSSMCQLIFAPDSRELLVLGFRGCQRFKFNSAKRKWYPELVLELTALQNSSSLELFCFRACFSTGPLRRLAVTSAHDNTLLVFNLENTTCKQEASSLKSQNAKFECFPEFYCHLPAGASRFLDIQLQPEQSTPLITLELEVTPFRNSPTTKSRIRWWDTVSGESKKSVRLDAQLDTSHSIETQFLHWQSKPTVAILNASILKLWDTTSGALLWDLDWALEGIPATPTFRLSTIHGNKILLSYLRDGKQRTELKDLDVRKGYRLHNNARLIAASACFRRYLVVNDADTTRQNGRVEESTRESELDVFSLRLEAQESSS